MMTWREYVDLAGVSGSENGADSIDSETVLGTFTPMSNVPAVHLNDVGVRRITLMRWGWINQKMHDPRKGFAHLHARSEEIDTTPTWVTPFREMRGLVWTKSFNIGEELPDGKIKQWVCTRADGKPVPIAVIYSEWEHMAFGLFRTCVMVTTASCPPLDRRDSRMPAILADEDAIKMWLGETEATANERKQLLRPYEGSLIIREQESTKPPRKATDKKPKARDPNHADSKTVSPEQGNLF